MDERYAYKDPNDNQVTSKTDYGKNYHLQYYYNYKNRKIILTNIIQIIQNFKFISSEL